MPILNNSNLHTARTGKNDEFHTRLFDIEKELEHYVQHFKDKVIFCNCDNPELSEFWNYFKFNFERFGLKKLISTHYDATQPTYKVEMFRPDEVFLQSGSFKVDDNTVITPLIQDGDFRSPECVEILKEADVVVTNPPFSLFREYVAQLVKYDKKFIILGNINAVTYKEIFPLLKNGKMWAGFSFNKTMEFIMPDSYQLKGKAFIDESGKKHGFVPSVCWFTNLDIQKRNEILPLHKKYSPEKYHHFDNYDAINVDKVTDIPDDYQGVMGVPITFLGVYNPEQFEIIGLGTCRELYTPTKTYIKPRKYFSDGRIVNANEINSTLVYSIKREEIKNVYYKADNSDKILFQPYARLLIRKK